MYLGGQLAITLTGSRYAGCMQHALQSNGQNMLIHQTTIFFLTAGYSWTASDIVKEHRSANDTVCLGRSGEYHMPQKAQKVKRDGTLPSLH